MRKKSVHTLRNVIPRLSSQQPQAALKQEARRDSLKLGSRRLPLKLGSEATAETKGAKQPLLSQPSPRLVQHAASNHYVNLCVDALAVGLQPGGLCAE